MIETGHENKKMFLTTENMVRQGAKSYIDNVRRARRAGRSRDYLFRLIDAFVWERVIDSLVPVKDLAWGDKNTMYPPNFPNWEQFVQQRYKLNYKKNIADVKGRVRISEV